MWIQDIAAISGLFAVFGVPCIAGMLLSIPRAKAWIMHRRFVLSILIVLAVIAGAGIVQAAETEYFSLGNDPTVMGVDLVGTAANSATVSSTLGTSGVFSNLYNVGSTVNGGNGMALVDAHLHYVAASAATTNGSLSMWFAMGANGSSSTFEGPLNTTGGLSRSPDAVFALPPSTTDDVVVQNIFAPTGYFKIMVLNSSGYTCTTGSTLDLQFKTKQVQP